MFNILIVGVGGQGSLLASRILGTLYLNQGLEVKVSEVHGMSQRGGSVVTYVRAGKDIASPIIPEGQADLIIAFEKLEALRFIHHLKPNGKVVYSNQEIDPMPVITGAAEYPRDIDVRLGGEGIPANTLAVKAGSVKAANVVLLGAASKTLPYDESAWKAAITETVPPKFLQLNLDAFCLGRNN